jgi:hypothetical protein
MPEVDVTLEATTIGERAVTAVTLRLHAEDALKLLKAAKGGEPGLDDEGALTFLARRAAATITFSGELPLSYVGGEVDGNAVYLFLATGPQAMVTDASLLSSVYDRWTNRVTDLRDGEPATKVFTQGGELHGHHH